MAIHSSNHAWKNPCTEEPGRLQSMGSQKSERTEHTHTHTHRGRHACTCAQCYGLPWVAQMVKNPLAMQETQIQSLDQEDSPGEANGHSLQYSCLENSMDRGAWPAIVHGVSKSWTRLRE